MQKLSYDPRAPALATGRVTPGEPINWRVEPGWSEPLSHHFVEGGADLEVLDISGDFVLARSGGVAGWLVGDRVSLPTTIVRIYKGDNQENAARAFQIEAAKWAQRGYYPTSQSWAQGSYGCGGFLVALLLCLILVGILIFIYMLLVKPAGTLTVTYELRADQLRTPQDSDQDRVASTGLPQSRRTKRCPQCAEDVLAEARICRFCRYDFNGTGDALPE